MDADPQGSAMHWRSLAGDGEIPFQVVQMAAPILHKQIHELGKEYDWVLIDCPPGGPVGVQNITRSALMSAAMALVPVQPTALDLWSAETMAVLIGKARVINQKLDCRFLVSRKIPNTILGREAQEAAAGYGYPVCRSEVSQRIALAEAVSAGQTILQFAPGGAAANEFAELALEIEEVI